VVAAIAFFPAVALVLKATLIKVHR
jgi:hypothetical protein